MILFVACTKSTVLTNIFIDKKEHLFRHLGFHSKQSLFMFNMFLFVMKPFLCKNITGIDVDFLSYQNTKLVRFHPVQLVHIV